MQGLVASQKLGGEAGVIVVVEPDVVDGVIKCGIRRRSERGK